MSKPNLVPLPEYTDLFTIKEFKGMVAIGAIIFYDGVGYFATKKGMDESKCVWSDDGMEQVPEWATHVAWFNK